MIKVVVVIIVVTRIVVIILMTPVLRNVYFPGLGLNPVCHCFGCCVLHLGEGLFPGTRPLNPENLHIIAISTIVFDTIIKTIFYYQNY